MKWELDDNERSAFHYLIGGAVAVLLLRGLALGLDAFHAPVLPAEEEAVLAPFRRGYLLGDGITVVGTFTGRMERLALAVVASVAGALLLGGLAALVARMMNGRPGRAAILAVRFSLVLLLGWSLYTVLFVPVQQTVVEEGGLLLRERRALIGDLALPFTLREEHVPHTTIVRLEAVRTPCDQGCDGTIRLELLSHDERLRIIARDNGICPKGELGRLRTASEAAALLEREMH